MLTPDTLFGTGFGAAIVLILGGIGKLVSIVRGDGNKILDTSIATKTIELQADKQDFAQNKEIISVLQNLLVRADQRADEVEKKFQAKLDLLEAKLAATAEKVNETSTKYSVLQVEYNFMESRVVVLENQLQIATSQNKEYYAKIEILERELAQANQKAEECECKAIEYMTKLREAEKVLQMRANNTA